MPSKPARSGSGRQGPQRDWAERAADRLQKRKWADAWYYGVEESDFTRSVAKLLRRAEKRGIIWAYNHYEQAELFVSGERSWRAKG